MVLAEGVTESFRKGLDLGSKIVEDYFDNKSRYKELEKNRLDKLVENYPDLFTPKTYQKALYEIDKTGKFSIPTEREVSGYQVDTNSPITAGISGAIQPAVINRTEPTTFSRPQKSSPTDIVAVTPELSNVTGLPVGSQIQRWQVEKVFAPSERAKTVASSQEQRQNTRYQQQLGLEDKRAEENRIRSQKDFRENIARSAYSEYLKAKSIGLEDNVREDLANALETAGYNKEQVDKFRMKEIPVEQEKSWFESLFGKAKEKVKSAVSTKTNSSEQETQTRKKNPDTGKWWIFKGGQWQPE